MPFEAFSFLKVPGKLKWCFLGGKNFAIPQLSNSLESFSLASSGRFLFSFFYTRGPSFVQ